MIPDPSDKPQLFTMPGTCALAPNIAAKWIDAPVEVVAMDYGEHKKDAYLAINPHGKVPALRFPDGDILTEAAAIMAWLGAAHGGEGYARDTKLGRKEAEALSYMTSEVHADFAPHFAAKSFADSDETQAAVKKKAYAKLDTHFRFMDDKLSANGSEYYLGEKSFADAYLYVLTRWIEQTPLSIDDYPELRAHRQRMQADADVNAALERQKMEAV